MNNDEAVSSYSERIKMNPANAYPYYKRANALRLFS